MQKIAGWDDGRLLRPGRDRGCRHARGPLNQVAGPIYRPDRDDPRLERHPQTATGLYEQWSACPPPDAGAVYHAVGTVGVYWPAMLWPDEAPPTEDGVDGGAVSLAEPDHRSAGGRAEPGLPRFRAAGNPPPASRRARRRVPEPRELDQFHELMRELRYRAAAISPRTRPADDARRGRADPRGPLRGHARPATSTGRGADSAAIRQGGAAVCPT